MRLFIGCSLSSPPLCIVELSPRGSLDECIQSSLDRPTRSPIPSPSLEPDTTDIAETSTRSSASDDDHSELADGSMVSSSTSDDEDSSSDFEPSIYDGKRKRPLTTEEQDVNSSSMEPLVKKHKLPAKLPLSFRLLTTTASLAYRSKTPPKTGAFNIDSSFLCLHRLTY